MRLAIRLVVSVALFLLAASCSERERLTDGDGGTGHRISTGESISILSETVGVEGGTRTINAPGEPIDGLEITIQPNSFDAAITLDISYAPILSHDFGTSFNPVTPLITINVGGVMSSKVVTVKIPVIASEDQSLMPFVYDPIDDVLLPMAILTTDEGSVTLLTRNFSEVVVSGIDRTELLSGTTIATSFNPCTDGWQVANDGSCLSPGGICAGMSISAIWYFLEICTPNLFGEFGNTMLEEEPPGFWKDDKDAIRFASMVQDDPTTWINFHQLYHNMSTSVNDQCTWEGLIHTMRLGRPELLCVYQTPPDSGAHAIVAYGVDLQNHRVNVYDPNFPGATGQFIQYDPGTKLFDPYDSRLRLSDPHVFFDQIGLFPLKAMCDQERLHDYWSSATVGNVGEFDFPPFDAYMHNAQGDSTLLLVAEQGNEDRVNHAEGDSIAFSIQSQDARYDFRFNLHQYYPLFGDTVEQMPTHSANILNGESYFGVELEAKKKSVNNAAWGWAGFQWYIIDLSPYIEEIVPASGAVGDTVTLNGFAFGDAGRRYVFFGDVVADVVSWSRKQVRATVPDLPEGEVQVSVTVEMRPSNKVTFDVIDTDHLRKLQAMDVINVDIYADHRSTTGHFSFPNKFKPTLTAVQWNGVQFSAEASDEWTSGTTEGFYEESLTGTVSPSGDELVSLTYTRHGETHTPAHDDHDAAYGIEDVSIIITNLELYTIYDSQGHFQLRGPECRTHATLSYRFESDSGNPFEDVWIHEYSHTEWDSQEDYPDISVYFRKSGQ